MQEHIPKAIAYLSEKCRNHNCPMCGCPTWEISEVIVETRQFHPGGGMVIGGSTIPYIPVMCTNCGNTQLFNALKMGLVTPSQPNQEVKP